MKPFELNRFCALLGIPPIKEEAVIIKDVRIKVTELNHDTLIFHLNKTHPINPERLRKLRNCFIITDQPCLKSHSFVKDRFIRVPNVEAAYQEFVRFYRNQFSLTAVAITGTCGKTTTKEMVREILKKRYRVTGTVLSRNALRFHHDYLLDIDDTFDYGVYELALTAPGQIIYSAAFFKPEIGVITNIGCDHLNGCGTLENLILAKGEMVTALNNQGTLIINSDDENIAKLDFSDYRGYILTFGIHKPGDFSAKDIISVDTGTKFTLRFRNKDYPVFLPTLGMHNVYNALAALAVIYALGMDIEFGISGLKGFKPLKAHLELLRGKNGSIIIDDTWSSNPTSVKAALATIRKFRGTKIAVIGNINCLGSYAEKECQNIAGWLVAERIDYLITIDAFSRRIGKYVRMLNLDKPKIINTKNEQELNRTLLKLLAPDVYCLFKISMFDKKLKTIIKSLTEEGERK